jgi:hypothetical protein
VHERARDHARELRREEDVRIEAALIEQEIVKFYNKKTYE